MILPVYECCTIMPMRLLALVNGKICKILNASLSLLCGFLMTSSLSVRSSRLRPSDSAILTKAI